jgi:hypothetical protein
MRTLQPCHEGLPSPGQEQVQQMRKIWPHHERLLGQQEQQKYVYEEKIR